MTIAAAFVILQLLCAACDLRCRRIPNVLPLAVVGVFGAAAAADLAAVDWGSHLGACAVAFLVTSALFYLRMMGGGDVKLLAATALWAGFPLLLPFLLATSLLGGLLVLFWLLLPNILRRGARLWPARRLASRLASLPASPPTNARELPPVPGPPGLPYGVAIAGAALVILPALPAHLFPF